MTANLGQCDMEVKIMETQHMEVAMSEPCMTEVEPTNARITP